MMKKIILLLAILMSFVSCDQILGDKEDPDKGDNGNNVTISEIILNFEAKGGTHNITLSSTGKWVAIANDSWATVTPSSGEAGETQNITITTPPYEEHKNRETAVIFAVVDADDNVLPQQTTMTVNQYQKNAIIIGEDLVELSYKSSELHVVVASNVNINIEMPENAKWITHHQTRNMANELFIFNVEDNLYSDREASIIFHNIETHVADTLTVKQGSKSAVFIDQKEYNLRSAAQTVDVKLSSNVGVETQIPTEANWISLAQRSKGLADTVITLVLTENPDAQARSAQIKFIHKESGASEIVTINHFHAGAVVIGEAEYTLARDAQDVDIKVATSANVAITIPVEANWITATKGKGEYKLHIKENTTKLQRVAGIVFTDQQTNESQTVTITQFDGDQSVIVLAPNETLESKFEGMVGDIRILKVKGEALTSDDFDFINTNMTNLVELDIFNTKTLSVPAKAFNQYDNSVNTKLTNVKLPNSVIELGYRAFRNCEKLTQINIPDGVKTIPTSSFSGCKNLQNITLPKELTSINERAFFQCASLTEMIVPEGVTEIESYAFAHCLNLTKITIPSTVKEMKLQIFSECTKLRTVNLPEGITEISSNMFYNCSSLTNITIPKSVTKINDYAFANCGALAAIDIHEGITEISKFAFLNCNKLTQVKLPTSLTILGISAFELCTNLNQINIPSNLKVISEGAFTGCEELTKIDIPASVTTIGKYAFEWCVKLIDLTIPVNGNLETIDDNAFSSCDRLLSFELPNKLKYLGSNAFWSCDFITSATIPEGVTAIGNNTFEFSGLQEVSLPTTLKSIGHEAFKHTNLTAIKLPEGLQSIGDRAFETSTLLKTITIPQSVTEMGDYVFNNCSELTQATLSTSMDYVPGAIFLDCRKLTDVTIPQNVTKIRGGAFSGCSGLQTITLPTNLKEIGGNAFSECKGIQSFVIPVGVTVIEATTFKSCAMTEIKFLGNIRSIGADAFVHCEKLKSITFSDELIDIGARAFQYCKTLKEIKLPLNLTIINEEAFAYCDNLNKVTSFSVRPPVLSPSAFESTNITSVIVPNNSVNDYKKAIFWKEFANVITGF